jgi:hypothetical protein
MISVAVHAFLSAYIPILGAYSPNTLAASTEPNKLSRNHPTVTSLLQTRSRRGNSSALDAVLSSTDSSEAPSSPLLSIHSEQSLSSERSLSNPAQHDKLSTDSSPSSSSSSSSNQSVVCNRSVMSSQAKFAVLEQDSPSKVPLLLPSDITPVVMRAFEHACLGYFDTKDVPAEKQVCKVLPGLTRQPHHGLDHHQS